MVRACGPKHGVDIWGLPEEGENVTEKLTGTNLAVELDWSDSRE